MLRAEIVPASATHVAVIADGARQADRDELWASSFSTVAEVLYRGLQASTHSWTVLYDDLPVAMAGVVPWSMLGGKGVPWMVATVDIERHPKPFAKLSKTYVAEMLRQYSHLINFVDDRNTMAIRYLKWLGFAMYDPEPHGVLKLPFRRFEMRAGHV